MVKTGKMNIYAVFIAFWVFGDTPVELPVIRRIELDGIIIIHNYHSGDNAF
jgi:hypothetical protein